jgi:hypothetical protein
MPNRARLVNLTGSFLCRYLIFRIYTTGNTTLFLNYSDALDDLQASGDAVRLHGTDNLLVLGTQHH